MTLEILRYRPDFAADWDRFVNGARNGVFLLRRSFMDYHADRFEDHSLIATYKGQPIAVFPANLAAGVLWSHQGLSYGGWIMAARVGAADMLRIVEAQRDYLRTHGVASTIVYKAIPSIYAEQCAQEDLYALHRHDAVLVRRDIGAAVNLAHPIGTDANRRYNVRKALKAGIQVRPSDDWAGFHAVLSAALGRHGATPTHSVAELMLLAARHPDNIALRIAVQEGRLLAGAVVFDTGRVVHTQYLASSTDGRRTGALDLVIETLKTDYAGARAYLSFGISTEDAGRVLNEGLAEHKEAFGARGVVHDVYELRV
jgi:hypothetical protein